MKIALSTNWCNSRLEDGGAIVDEALSLGFDALEFYGGRWMKEPGKVITCCNDGLRPVYFKLEATDDDAGPFLGRE